MASSPLLQEAWGQCFAGVLQGMHAVGQSTFLLVVQFALALPSFRTLPGPLPVQYWQWSSCRTDACPQVDTLRTSILRRALIAHPSSPLLAGLSPSWNFAPGPPSWSKGSRPLASSRVPALNAPLPLARSLSWTKGMSSVATWHHSTWVASFSGACHARAQQEPLVNLGWSPPQRYTGWLPARGLSLDSSHAGSLCRTRKCVTMLGGSGHSPSEPPRQLSGSGRFTCHQNSCSMSSISRPFPSPTLLHSLGNVAAACACGSHRPRRPHRASC